MINLGKHPTTQAAAEGKLWSKLPSFIRPEKSCICVCLANNASEVLLIEKKEKYRAPVNFDEKRSSMTTCSHWNNNLDLFYGWKSDVNSNALSKCTAEIFYVMTSHQTSAEFACNIAACDISTFDESEDLVVGIFHYTRSVLYTPIYSKILLHAPK